MKILHIVPRVPPSVCGVGDYAVVVGRGITTLKPSVESIYLACGVANKSVAIASTESNYYCAEPNSHAVCTLLETLSEPKDGKGLVILLHYSGYGYSSSGSPKWLPHVLEYAHQKKGTLGIITFFHELFATGYPWSRAFWNSKAQRSTAIQIAELSSVMVTNRKQSALILESTASKAAETIKVMPVCSNVGEPPRIVDFSNRQPYIVLFGGVRFKKPFLQGRYKKFTVLLCKKLCVSRIVCIGQLMDIDTSYFRKNGIELVQEGVVAATNVSLLLGAARAALVDYFPGYYAKSGVLAAVAAHGTPVVTLTTRECSDGLRAGYELNSIRTLINLEDDAIARVLQTGSDCIHQWYSNHSVGRHCQVLTQMIASMETQETRLRV